MKSTNIWSLLLILTIASLAKSASVNNNHKQRNNGNYLNVLEKDFSQIGNAITNITFDFIRNLLVGGVEQPDDTADKSRKRRSTPEQENQEIETLCRQHYNDCVSSKRAENEQIQDLKIEVDKLQDLVKVLRTQHRVMHDLKRFQQKQQQEEQQPQQQQHEVAQRDQPMSDDSAIVVRNKSLNDLANLKLNLQQAIISLNQTRELINNQRQKSELLEEELIRQKAEIKSLKSLVRQVLNRTDSSSPIVGDPNFDNSTQAQGRASEFSELKKFLDAHQSKVDDDDEAIDRELTSSAEIQTRILELEKKLKKKKNNQSLAKEIKLLEQRLLDDDASKNKDNNKKFLRELSLALSASSKSDDQQINSLNDLQEAINKLRPKEDNNSGRQDSSADFQAMLNKLIQNNNNGPVINTNSNSGRPFVGPSSSSVVPQQQGNYNGAPNPYICVVDDGTGPKTGYKVPLYNAPSNYGPSQIYSSGPHVAPQVYQGPQAQYSSYPPPVPQYSNYQQPPQQQKFFPAPAPAYRPPEVYTAANQDKSSGYQYDVDQKYQEDLRAQIDGLQGAIDTLNRPENYQKPEDKAMIQDLENQITDLKGVVSNLNTYEPTSYRTKREIKNVEDFVGEFGKAMMSDFKGNSIDDDGKNREEIKAIRDRIEKIKIQLGNKSNSTGSAPITQQSQTRSAYDDYNYDYEPPALFKKSEAKELIKEKHNDIFAAIVAHILDKVLNTLPLIVKKLFNFGFDELTRNDDYGDYDVQVLFKNLGVLGLFPVLILRLVKGFSTFLNILRKNSFFRNFLIPILILGTVAGSIIFLIWWLQPGDYYHKAIDYDYNNNNNYNSYENNDQNYNEISVYRNNPAVSYNSRNNFVPISNKIKN